MRRQGDNEDDDKKEEGGKGVERKDKCESKSKEEMQENMK